MPNRVFVINRSSHDYSDAKRFGELRFLSDGRLDRFATTSMFRLIEAEMAEASEGDWIVQTSLSVMFGLACAFFAHRFGRLNLLIFKNDHYEQRVVDLMKGGE